MSTPARSLAAALLLSAAPLAAEPADWNGVWFTEQGAGTQISGFLANDDPRRSRQLPLIDLTAPWTDEARARFQERLSQAAISKSEGWGYPMMMMSLTPLEFVVTPGQTLIFTIYRDVRRIATDGRALSPLEDRWATAWGESVGSWEGDTLVVETTNFKGEFFGRMAAADENLRVVERFTRVAPDVLLYQFTVDDPTAWTAPWSGEIPLTRIDGLLYEYACHEGNRGMENILRAARQEIREAGAQ